MSLEVVDDEVIEEPDEEDEVLEADELELTGLEDTVVVDETEEVEVDWEDEEGTSLRACRGLMLVQKDVPGAGSNYDDDEDHDQNYTANRQRVFLRNIFQIYPP